MPMISCGNDRRIQDAGDEGGRAKTEVAAGIDVDRGNASHRVDGGEQQREEAAEKDQKDGGEVADAEPQDGDRNPGQRRDGAKDLNQGIERHFCAAIPADHEPQGNRQNSGQSEAPGDAEKRSDDVLEQQPVLQEVADSGDDSPGSGQKVDGVPGDGKLPQQQQDRYERYRAETDHQAFRPLSFRRIESRGAQSDSSAIART